jgi:hypothetical protein
MTVSKRGDAADSGFALVVMLSLMVLLTVVAVGLLSLSAMSLRTSSQGMLMGQAQANARLAMMLDKPAEPHAAGVWESWTWDPTKATAVPDYARAKQSLFRGWPVSDNLEPGRRLDADFPLEGPGNPVTLVDAGSAVAWATVASGRHGRPAGWARTTYLHHTQQITQYPGKHQ